LINRVSPGAALFFILLAITLVCAIVVVRARTPDLVLEETGELHRLVEDLLFLAREDAHDGRRNGTAAHPVDLDVVVGREAARVRTEGRVDVDTSAVSAARVLGDQAQLSRAVRNVLDNAARHAVERVAVAVGEEGEVVTVSVTDDGAGIPTEERERVFERFARVDASRRAGAAGSGLGLAIARDIVVRHSGTIAVDPHHHPGARIVLRLPRSDR